AQEVNARNSLSYTEVKAPSNGVVGTLPYRVGALVGPSIPQPLTTVSDNSSMYVYFSMNENRLLSLVREYGSMDKVMEAMPEVSLQLSDGSVYESAGRIESISGVVDRSTGSVQLRAVFPNENRMLHSGSTGNVVMPNVRNNVVVIPQTATFELQDKIYVYKVIDGKASSSMIAVDKISDGREYIVLSGLEPGDVIVAEGVGLMREGTPVTPKGQAAPAQAETVNEE
ncbi:MAG: efflux RND transporter periplasmic adaptor subunit, partial [Alistipes sp.]|nr:efflux RND transporter periplasmic adaptor subunit [Alistipes sp.]